MSSTNKTTYFELPQFIGTDIPTWLGDFNGAMSDIDTALKTNADRADLASTQAGQAVNTANAANDAVSALQTSVAGLADRVTACEATDTAQSSQISGLTGDVAGLDARVTTLEQSGGGGTGHDVGIINLGSYSGTSFNNATVFNGSTIPDHVLGLGILVDVTIGNAHGQAYVQPSGDILANGFAVTVVLMNRVYSSTVANVRFLQLQCASAGSNGQRSIQYASLLTLPFTAGSGTSGNATAGTPRFNTNGADGEDISIKLIGFYRDQSN